ncbi:MAG: tetratricopeptide repeat protein [Candidatus Marinimicrobia bacterium]|nr:tetratricopeptide repeat protein [Candidatus Neomarinimicrobiota bacterium]
MTPLQTYIVLAVLVTGSLAMGQTGAGNLLYDIGLMIDDSSTAIPDNGLKNSFAPELSQKEQVLEEELNRYQQQLAETEIRLLYQTRIIDSLQTEIALIKAAGETDQALLSTRITSLVDQQEKAAKKALFVTGGAQVSDSVYAELDTPWKNVNLRTQQPQIRNQIGPRLTTAEEQTAYRKGLTKFHQQYYYQAIDEFNTIVQRGSDLTMQANAQYWVGRCYFEKGLYDEAIGALEQVQRYKHSDKLDDALVMIGLAFKNKNRLPEAKLAFQELVTRHPGSEYLILAKRFVQQ